MTLSNKQLSEAVSAVKLTLMLHCSCNLQTKQVLEEVNAQVLEGKTQDLHMKYRVSKLQQDNDVMAFLIKQPLEMLTQAKCIELCIKEFGSERAPKRNALSRHWGLLKRKRKERYGKQ